MFGLLAISVMLLGIFTVFNAPSAHATPAPGKYFDNVVTIVMENAGENSSDPYSGAYVIPTSSYQTSLANAHSWASGYSGVAHPSLPNYLALIGGSTFGCTSDTCISPGSLSNSNLIDRLGTLTWQAYAEDYPANQQCSLTTSSGNYASKHFPFVYFSDITNNATRCNNLFATTAGSDAQFLTALNTTMPNYLWLTPNLCNDGHDCGQSTADSYLSTLVPKILNSLEFTTKRSVLFITYDEGGGMHPNDWVYSVVMGPQALTGYKSLNQFSHYSWLHTVEVNWGLSCISNDCSAPIMSEFFKSGTDSNPIVNTGSFDSTWFLSACPSPTNSSARIDSNGILHERLNNTSGGFTTGYCGTAGYGSPDWIRPPAVGSKPVLNFSSLNVEFYYQNFSVSSNSSNEIRVYLGLYFQFATAQTGWSIIYDGSNVTVTSREIDSQFVFSNYYNGAYSANQSYTSNRPSGMFDYRQFIGQDSPGNLYTYDNINVTAWYQACLIAWHIKGNLPQQLFNVEPGVEGYGTKYANVEWFKTLSSSADFRISAVGGPACGENDPEGTTASTGSYTSTSGDIIVVVAGTMHGPITFTSSMVTDTIGNAYSLRTSNNEVGIWTATAKSTGTNSIAFTNSGSSTFYAVCAEEYSGASVGTNENTSSGSGTPLTVAVSGAASASWVVGGFISWDTASISMSSPDVLRQSYVNFNLNINEGDVPASGSPTLTVLSASQTWYGAAVELKPGS